jgi:hypothetical protein
MTFRLNLFTRNQMYGLAIVFGLALFMLFVAPAIAGGDTTFDPITSRINAWLSGSLGYAIALVAFLTGVVNAIRGERSFWGMAFPFFLSIIITVGITVIQGGFTAVI